MVRNVQQRLQNKKRNYRLQYLKPNQKNWRKMSYVKSVSQVHLQNVLTDLTNFQCSNALQTEQLKCDKQVVKNSIEYVLLDPSMGQFLLYINPENPNQICGSLYITFEDKDNWWIQSVYVAENHRRKGIFSALFKAAAQKAKNQNVSKLHLCVLKDNEKAKKAYKKVGLQLNGYQFYGVQFIFGDSQLQFSLQSQLPQGYSVENAEQLSLNCIHQSEVTKILGELTGTKKAMQCMFEDQLTGYCEYYEQFCDWRGATVVIITALYTQFGHEKKVIECFLKKLYNENNLDIGSIRFKVNNEELQILKRINGNMEEFQYDVMEININ